MVERHLAQNIPFSSGRQGSPISGLDEGPNMRLRGRGRIGVDLPSENRVDAAKHLNAAPATQSRLEVRGKLLVERKAKKLGGRRLDLT